MHYFDVIKPFEKITRIIGLSTGVITFVLTLVYICYGGYIFTNQVPSNSYDNVLSFKLKLDKEGAYDKKKGNEYKCLYYRNNKDNPGHIKYGDLGKRQYNYKTKKITQKIILNILDVNLMLLLAYPKNISIQPLQLL